MQIVSVSLPLIGSGFLGYFAKYYLDKKQEHTSKNAEFKRAAYSEVIDLLLGVLSQSKLGKLSDKQLTQKINSAYGQCILYASPDVINAFGDTMQYIYINKDDINAKLLMTNITKIFMHMREDIGLSNESLGLDARRLMRVKLNDYSEVIEP